MKQTLESAAKQGAEGYNIVGQTIYKSGFRDGAEWHAKQSPWIRVIVYNGKQVYMSHRTEKDYAKDTNSFLYGLQTYNVVAWMPIPSFDETLEANRDVLEQ